MPVSVCLIIGKVSFLVEISVSREKVGTQEVDRRIDEDQGDDLAKVAATRSLGRAAVFSKLGWKGTAVVKVRNTAYGSDVVLKLQVAGS